eukprot:scaffold31854_cov112-Isochrysis_galbana.AAC.1
MARSLASVPEFTKKTLDNGSGKVAASAAASLDILSWTYLELVLRVLSCCVAAATIRGWQ